MHAMTSLAGRAIIATLAIAGTCMGMSLIAVPAAIASCTLDDPNCVSVGAESPGAEGSPGDTSGGGESSNQGGASGDQEPPPSCWWQSVSPQPTDPTDPLLEGHELGSGVVQEHLCYGNPANDTGFNGMIINTGERRFIEAGDPAAADPSPAELAQRAAASFRLPDPVWGRFPSFTLQDGRPYTVVKTHMWFWTDPATWAPLTATASAGANWASVTATPVALQLVPGDGSGAVECASAGSAFDKARDAYRTSWVPQPQPDGCDYVYQRSTWDYPNEMLTATLSIRWELSWTGSGGTAGTLTSKVTSTDSTFVVAEAQAVVTG